ncbi:hypothetical protein COO60DRAFT_770715 [Scenedesmus sp. NREL 46B-D3]|nr:hypothetical protein COO60DRAFT_770715 [Scenedesmus sp. NREL 46B-D3]
MCGIARSSCLLMVFYWDISYVRAQPVKKKKHSQPVCLYSASQTWDLSLKGCPAQLNWLLVFYIVLQILTTSASSNIKLQWLKLACTSTQHLHVSVWDMFYTILSAITVKGRMRTVPPSGS